MKIDDYRTLKHLNLRLKNQNHNIWNINPAEKGYVWVFKFSSGISTMGQPI